VLPESARGLAHSKTWRLLVALLLLSTLNPQLSTALAQGTAFTYQGRLNTGGNPATFPLPQRKLSPTATGNRLNFSPIQLN
jgi:hypothetical protein